MYMLSEYFQSSRRVGRPKKKKASQGRPGARDRMISAISTSAPSTHNITQEVAEYVLPPSTPISLADIECAVCHSVLERPLQLPCGQLCCTLCLYAWVTHTVTADPLSCPCCQRTHSIHESQLFPSPQVLQKLLDTLHVHCRRCLKIVTAGEFHTLSTSRVAANFTYSCMSQRRTQVQFLIFFL